MKKKILAFLLAAVLAVGTGSACAAASGPVMNFPDVPEGIWYYTYVKDLYEQGVVDGYGDGTFSGLANMPWGQAFKLILLTIGCEEPEPVEGETWDYPYIELAIENKLVYSFDKEHLNDIPTRLQVAHMVARALDLVSISGESPYADCDDGYVVELYEKGVMIGTYGDDGALYFNPDQPITRAEVMAILWRMQNLDIYHGMFHYNNYWLDPLEGVAPMSYQAEQFVQVNDQLTYTGGTYTRGVDVSGFQGDIDWAAVKADGIDFAIIRVGGRFMQSGGLYDDSYFQKNIEGALAAGLDVGVYFFSQAITVEEAQEEADYVLERIQGYPITYPVVFDWEYLGGSSSRTYGVEPTVISNCAIAFCDRIAQAGYTPMVYFNAYCGYIKFDLRMIDQYDFWYAQYSSAPNFRYNFQMWQYTSSGQVDGISGSVDMNLCFKPY